MSEIYVDPNTGRWYSVGDNGAEFVDIPEGAIVFNHKQSESLLKYGHVAGRGKASVNGTAYVSGTLPGYIPKPKPPGSGSSSGSSGSHSSGSSGSGSSYTPGHSSSSSDDTKSNEPDWYDWIEIIIDRIERGIQKLKKTADSAFKALNTRLEASREQIGEVTQEIRIQEEAYDAYMRAADSVGLSPVLKQLVQDGTIDVSKYDDDTRKLIEEYREFYEKALDCKDAIDDLHESIAQIYKDNFDKIQQGYDDRMSMMEKRATALQNKTDMLETGGYLLNVDYYEGLQKIQKEKIDAMQLELLDLNKAFNAAMGSGEIEEGSEAWYEMLGEIEDVKNAIDEANISIVDFGNKIREIEWSYFDFAQERVSKIVDEAEFLSSLIGDENMYDENGRLSDAGVATAGIYAEKYGLYMAQADKYAEEIKRINSDLAKDPNNKNLIARKDELLEAQRESILAAKDEQQAMVDLAKNGIQVELDAVKKLIDAYTDSLDSAKDLYDYQKKIADKTANIASLEKQLAAYQNDMSEETKAKIQKIQVDLKTAKEDLKDTEYDRFVSDSKKLLDSMYNEYEEVLNSRFDDVVGTFEKMITMVNDNFVNISDYFTDAASKVGYTVTEGTKSIWENGGVAYGVVEVYGSKINDGVSSVVTTVENIFGLLEEIAKQNGVSFVGAKSYKSGGLIDYTGIANVHGTPSNPETVLNAEDSKNFVVLRDALRTLSAKDLLQTNSSIFERAVVPTQLSNIPSNSGGYSVGQINVTIPIDHVEDYNDFMNQLKSDRKFEQMVQSMTVGRLAGRSSLEKNKYKW